VKQIVGGTLTGSGGGPVENFVSELPPAHYAGLYARDGLAGGHVIMLGKGNRAAALEALAAYPGGLQMGGGITLENAGSYLDSGASHVIVTSWLFSKGGVFQKERLRALVETVGKRRLVIDLSCRADGDGWRVAMDRWQTPTDVEITPESLDRFRGSCAELLIHAADVEGKCGGIDARLVEMLGQWAGLPVTYAGGASSVDDLALVDSLSGGVVDLTIGSALDIFGGSGARYADCVVWNGRSKPSV